MITGSAIKQYVLLNFRNLFQDEFSVLADPTIGEPVSLYDQDKVHRYWLVPILVQQKVRGVIMFHTEGSLVYYGRLMPNVQNLDDLIDINYFEHIPEKWLQEVKAHYPEYLMVDSFFSYDRIPQKWGWLVELKHRQSEQFVQVYIGPTGWYTKKPELDYEG